MNESFPELLSCRNMPEIYARNISCVTTSGSDVVLTLVSNIQCHLPKTIMVN